MVPHLATMHRRGHLLQAAASGVTERADLRRALNGEVAGVEGDRDRGTVWPFRSPFLCSVVHSRESWKDVSVKFLVEFAVLIGAQSLLLPRRLVVRATEHEGILISIRGPMQ